MDDVVVIVPSQNNIDNLTADQIHSVFLGQVTNWKDVGGSDMPIQVWAYAQGEDIQQIFEQNVMEDQPVTSLARLAVSAQKYVRLDCKQRGFHWVYAAQFGNGECRDVYKIPSEPVLAITKSQPEGEMKDLLACLQRQK